MHGIIDCLLLIFKVCAIYCANQMRLLFIVHCKKNTEWSVDSRPTEQYPLNIQWTVLSNVGCVFGVFRNIHLLLTVLRYVHCTVWSILRYVHSGRVENENFMSSKAFPLSK